MLRRYSKTIFLFMMTGVLFISACGRGTHAGSTSVTITASASPDTITAGQSSVLSWTTTNATSVSINNGIGAVGLNGPLSVQPATTTTYQLTATGNGGTAMASATVTVNPLAQGTGSPTIQASASPSTISLGSSTTLSWSTTNATSVFIDNGIGTVGANGTAQTVQPSATTTYHLTATGPGGTAAASVTVTVSACTVTGNVDVPTWHMDNARSGLNANETALTPANVNASNFGKLFSYLVDGYIYAQPLYVSALNIGGVSHNVVFAATEYDSIYAFDADGCSGSNPLWKKSLLQNGETPQPGGNPLPYQGLTSTPVIDLVSNTMYVVSAQKSTGNAFFRLHALDIITGAERAGSPVVISASVPGTNSDSVNGILTLNTSCLQRTALLLSNGTLFFGFSACHSGWLLAYNAQTLAQVGVLNMSPNTNGTSVPYGGAGGVWMGGGGPVADGAGYIYVTTGNGPYDGHTAWGDSLLKLDSSLNIIDHFTPDDYVFLSCHDLDLSGGGAMLLGGSQVLAGGKGGKMYLANISDLGQVQANDAGAAEWLWFNNSSFSENCTDSQNVQSSGTAAGYQIFATAAYFNGSVYLGVTPGPVQQFAYGSGRLTTGPVTAQSVASGSYGSTPFVSANGTTNGIVWVLDHGNPIQSSSPTSAVLRAYDATNISKPELYDSAQNSADVPGYGIKFTSPIVVNGKVFIGTAHDPLSATNPQGELDVYGLKN